MIPFLSDEWLERCRALGAELPERTGATARVRYRITGGPDGDVTYVVAMEEGRLTEARWGDDEDVHFTVTQPFEEHREVVAGQLDPNVAFMRGTLKVTGDMGRFLALLPLAETEECKAAARTLAAQTRF